MTTNEHAVTQMRLVVTVDDLDEAVAFYRDALGLPVEAAFDAEGRRVVILDAGRATHEIGDAGHAAYVDEVEVGRRVAGRIRVAFDVDDASPRTDRLAEAGAAVIAPATKTPWNTLNSRLEAPGGRQLTLFQALAPETMA
jgi:lactoylglutathione lyase